MSYPFNIKRSRCTITASGSPLATGDTVTSSDALRSTTIETNDIKLVYRENGSSNPASCHLYVKNNEEWVRCFDAVEADWAYYVVAPSAQADRIKVIEASDDAVEISIEWDAYSLTGYGGGAGFNSRDYARNLIYPSSSTTPRQIASLKLRKVVRVVRGLKGYFAAWHSAPNFVPMITAVGQAANNELDLGEREMGTGGGSRVTWASSGVVCYSPAWRDQRDWSAFAAHSPSSDNYHCWLGSDDITAPPFNHATFIAMQPAGFPAEAASGGFYAADIYPTTNVVRYIVQKNPNQIGVWHYDGQNGILVNHLTNPWVEADGRPTRFPIFIGAEYYVADSTSAAVSGYTGNVAYGNEPSTTIRATIASRVADVTGAWPR